MGNKQSKKDPGKGAPPPAQPQPVYQEEDPQSPQNPRAEGVVDSPACPATSPAPYAAPVPVIKPHVFAFPVAIRPEEPEWSGEHTVGAERTVETGIPPLPSLDSQGNVADDSVSDNTVSDLPTPGTSIEQSSVEQTGTSYATTTVQSTVRPDDGFTTQDPDSVPVADQPAETNKGSFATVDTTGRPKVFTSMDLPPNTLNLQDVLDEILQTRSHFSRMDSLVKEVDTELQDSESHLRELQQLIGSADIQGFIALYQRLNKTEGSIRVKASGGDIEGARALLPKRDDCFDKSFSRANSVIEVMAKLMTLEKDRAASVAVTIDRMDNIRSNMTGLTMADMVLNLAQSVPIESQPDRSLADYLTMYREAREKCQETLGPAFTKTEVAMKNLLEAFEEEKAAILEHPDVFYNTFESALRVVTGVDRYQRKLKKENANRNLQHTQALHRKCQNVKTELDRVVKERVEVTELKEKYRVLSGELLAAREKYIDLAAELERLKLRDEDPERQQKTQLRLQTQGETIQKKAADLESYGSRLSELSLGHHPELLCDSDKSVSNSVRATGLVTNRKLADYQDVKMLSTGSNHVFTALNGEHKVVLKQLPVLDKKALENEIRLLHRLRHPHVIELRSVFYEGLYAYLEMPFMQNGSMKDWLLSKRPSPPELQHVFRHILQGVAYLHDRHVIHRDLNFSNILINAAEQPVICDFGISKEQSLVTQTQGARTAIIGTQGFMAPEVEAGERARPACDVWAVGIMIYHAHFPEGPAPIPDKGMMHIPKHENSWLRDLLTHMLKLDPQGRPPAATLLTHPYFSTPLQNQLYKSLVKRDRDIEFFQEHLTTITGRSTAPHTINVRFETCVESLIKAFSVMTEESMAKPIFLDFVGDEIRSDDVYTVFFQEILSVQYGLFECASDDPVAKQSRPGEKVSRDQRALAPNSPLYLPSPTAEDMHSFEMCGRILLKLLLDKSPAPVPFARALYQYLLGRQLTLSDLDLYDREKALVLRELLATPVDSKTVVWPGTADEERELDNNSKQEYVNAVIQWELVGKRRRQLDAMKKGFNLIPLANWLNEVTTTDFVILVSGSGHVDSGMILEHLEFNPPESQWSQESTTIADLKSFLAELRPRDLRRFLYLFSGSAYVPSGGFRHNATNLPTKLTVQQAEGVNEGIRAFAPDYLLLIPDYHHRDILSEKLLTLVYSA